MRPSRGMGTLVLTLVGVSGCAGMPQRGTTTSPMEPPAAVAPARQTGWRGWWSRWRAPSATPARAATFDPDLPVETTGRIGPETNIWPARSRGPLSRMLRLGLAPRAGDQPGLQMTAAEANEAIARLAHPRKTDDRLVLPVSLWTDSGDSDKPSPTTTPTRRPAFDGQPATGEHPEPISAPGAVIDRFSTQPRPKFDSDARSASTTEPGAAVDPAEDVGPPPLVSRGSDANVTPTLATLVQTPPPPPVRPEPRVESAPPPPPIEAPRPAAPAAVAPTEPKEAPRPAEPAKLEEQTPEPPSSSLPAASPSPEDPTAASTPSPTVQSSAPFVAAPQSGWSSGQAVLASAPADAAGPHRWSLLKWFRPQKPAPGRLHHPGVFPSPQGPVELPPVLVPTSYYASLNRPSAQAPPQQCVTPTAQGACVIPSGQCSSPANPPKKECFLVNRLHQRWEQYRQWKHAHICKHIQGLKDLLAGKRHCEACGKVIAPSSQSLPSPQVSLPAPTPQAQNQSASWPLFRHVF